MKIFFVVFGYSNVFCYFLINN